MRYALSNAAGLAEASYRVGAHAPVLSRIVDSIDEADVQAHLLDNGLLLIPGSNSVDDYLRYNLRIDIGGRQYRLRDASTGRALGARWHEGFLAHAMIIRRHLERRRPRFIIGHSLGAASAQVLSLLWRVPAVCFAAPRIQAGRDRVANDRLCLCLWRRDDPVGTFPNDRFHHVGTSIRLDHGRTTGLLNHSMSHYRAALARSPQLPSSWPSPGR